MDPPSLSMSRDILVFKAPGQKDALGPRNASLLSPSPWKRLGGFLHAQTESEPPLAGASAVRVITPESLPQYYSIWLQTILAARSIAKPSLPNMQYKVKVKPQA